MEAHPRPVIDHRRVIQPAAIRKERHIEVSGRRQAVRQVVPRVDIVETNLRFVLASQAEQVSQNLPVLGNIRNFGIGGMIRAHGVRVDQHLVGATFSLPQVDHRLFLVWRALPKEETPGAFGRRLDDFHLLQLRQPLLDRAPSRPPVQKRMGVGVLSLDPLSRLRTVLVFQPPVRIGHGYAVQHFGDIVARRYRRA